VFIVCPNKECEKATISVWTHAWIHDRQYNVVDDLTPIKTWRLVPDSSARVFPVYVPAAIREDYEEACKIRELSPKASATLARRALQGILRDFYKVKPGNLANEIDALEGTMEQELFDAIHALRKVGNIGAHMEKDIDLIVDVDPDEAQQLIELVETLIDETYIRRETRAKRLERVTALAVAKEAVRKGGVAD
jgi:hypothetical protein